MLDTSEASVSPYTYSTPDDQVEIRSHGFFRNVRRTSLVASKFEAFVATISFFLSTGDTNVLENAMPLSTS